VPTGGTVVPSMAAHLRKTEPPKTCFQPIMAKLARDFAPPSKTSPVKYVSYKLPITSFNLEKMLFNAGHFGSVSKQPSPSVAWVSHRVSSSNHIGCKVAASLCLVRGEFESAKTSSLIDSSQLPASELCNRNGCLWHHAIVPCQSPHTAPGLVSSQRTHMPGTWARMS